MDLSVEVLCLFGKQFLVPEITLKYVTLKNSLWMAGINMVFNPCLFNPSFGWTPCSYFFISFFEFA